MANPSIRRGRRTPPGYHDMAFAVEFTGRTRQTLMKAANSGEIPGAIQVKSHSPWYFTEQGLRHYLGIRDQAAAS
jgi:hypothetical protein